MKLLFIVHEQMNFMSLNWKKVMHNYTDSKVFTNKNYNIDLFHIKNQIHYLNI